MLRSIDVANWPYRPLHCPRCGNRGEATFSAATFVFIGADGVPNFVGPYPEALEDSLIDCHGCDYQAPLTAFTERHRPGAERSRRRSSLS